MMKLKNKEDIEFHKLGYNSVPAVNVKVYDSLSNGFRKFVETEGEENIDPRFTEEWIEENVPQDAFEYYWMDACEQGWDDLQNKACEIYGSQMIEDRSGRHFRYRVYSEGRSGGWAYIDGINHDVESWDAIEFSQWKRFAEYARIRADWIMYDIVWAIYHNRFEEWQLEQSELAAPEIPEGLRA